MIPSVKLLKNTNQHINTDQYHDILVNDKALMDVRAPIEFVKGAFPGASNLPLLNDEERAAVGTRYKEQGQDAAIALGHKYISGETKEQRIAAWVDFTKQHPDGYLYCFRGGLRSRLTQQALQEVGIDYPLIEGGYKSMRRYLIDALEDECQHGKFIVITGRTGTGKTVAITTLANTALAGTTLASTALANVVDLEGIANHKGSTFGHSLTPQPSQIDFENKLAIALLKLRTKHTIENKNSIFAEDESRLIGRCCLPPAFLNTLQQAPLVRILESIPSRLDLIIQEYIVDNLAAYKAYFGNTALIEFKAYVLARLAKIRKRLGGERHQQLQTLTKQAFEQQQHDADPQHHRAWIEQLLIEYYDPMYDYQLNKKNTPILFQGSRAEVIEWAALYGSKV